MSRPRTLPAPLLLILAAPLALGLSAARVQAYDPPVDTAGPLAVRIEGPEEVTEIEVPLPVRVVIRNRGEKPVQGTLELGVIDRWRAEPAGPVRFPPLRRLPSRPRESQVTIHRPG